MSNPPLFGPCRPEAGPEGCSRPGVSVAMVARISYCHSGASVARTRCNIARGVHRASAAVSAVATTCMSLRTEGRALARQHFARLRSPLTRC